MNSRTKWSSAGLILIVAGAALAPWTLGEGGVSAQLAAQARRVAGLEIEPPERIAFAVLPRPHIKVQGLRLRDPRGALDVDAPVIKADLRILPLLAGRLELSNLTLIGPHITVDLARRPSLAVDVVQNRLGNSGPLAAIAVTGGAVTLREATAAPLVELSDMSASLDWRSADAPAALSSAFLWRGERATLDAYIAKPTALSGAGATPFTLEWKAPSLTATFDGQLSGGARWQYVGRLTAQTATPARFARSLGVPLRDAPVDLTAQATIHEGAIALADMTLRIGDARFDGALALRRENDRPVFSATLATPDLALDPRANVLPRITGADRRWNNEPVNLRLLANADIDVRLSATRASFGRIAVADVAVAALARNGRLEASFASSKAYGGAARLRLSLNAADALPAFKISGQFSAVKTADFLRDAMRNARLSGQADGVIDIAGAGVSIAEAMRAMTGAARVDLRNGSIFGLDLAQGLRRARTRPLTLLADLANGQTQFVRAWAAARIGDGVMRIVDSAVESDDVRAVVQGEVHLLERALKLGIAASAATDGKVNQKGDQKSDGKDPVELALDVVGPWAAPTLLIDPEALINRSQAAAPLLRGQKAPTEPALSAPIPGSPPIAPSPPESPPVPDP